MLKDDCEELIIVPIDGPYCWAKGPVGDWNGAVKIETCEGCERYVKASFNKD